MNTIGGMFAVRKKIVVKLSQLRFDICFNKKHNKIICTIITVYYSKI